MRTRLRTGSFQAAPNADLMVFRTERSVPVVCPFLPSDSDTSLNTAVMYPRVIKAAMPNGTDKEMNVSCPKAGSPGASRGKAPPTTVPRHRAIPSAVPPLAKPGVRSASASELRMASTNQASSGPELRARPAPRKTDAATNIDTLVAVPQTTIATTWRAAGKSNTGRRSMVSASPPVGSSRTATVTPWMARIAPAVATDKPRC